MQVEREASSSEGVGSGERVSNTLVTYPEEGNNRRKRRLMPRRSKGLEAPRLKPRRLGRGLRAIS